MIARNSGVYFEMVNDIIHSEYNKNPQNLYLLNRDITEILKTELIRKNKKVPTTPTSAVSKATKSLIKANKIFELDDFFYPNITEAKRFYFGKKLEDLPFNDNGIFFVSPSTILLSIKDFPKKKTAQDVNEENKISKKKNTTKSLDKKQVVGYLTEYLSENCFSIEMTKKYVVLLIKGSADELTAIGEDLKRIVENSVLHQKDRRTMPERIKKTNQKRTNTTKKEDASN